MCDKFLTLDNMNPHIRGMEFMGAVAGRAMELRRELLKGIKNPFTEVIHAHIGDCQAMGQKPLTYVRQIISLVLLPELMEDPKFPEDVKSKARAVLNGCRSIGSYSDSPGSETVRRQIARYIEERDGYPSSWERIVCSNGAADIIRLVLELFQKEDEITGVMVPIPLSPLYQAAITEFNLHSIKYYLDESDNWAVDVAELTRAIKEERKHCKPKAIVVINPGIPTGQVLTRDTIESIIKFAHQENLFILADEVYQDNVYPPECGFHSFRKVMMEMGEPYSCVQLASFLSGSKGFTGECGLRAGCVEMVNVDPRVVAMLVKMVASTTCPTVLGQTVMYCLTNPPKPGEPSYELYQEEKSKIREDFKMKARIAEEKFNSMPGYSCRVVQGAIYAFPSVTLPLSAVNAAKGKFRDACELYAMELLEATGICVSPGCVFGQKPGTHHIRTTIALPLDKLREMLDKIEEFHHAFLLKYR